MSLTLSPNAPTTFPDAEIDRRLTFHAEDQILEIDLSGLTLENSADANHLYDRVEAAIARSGETSWFFLIDYGETKIDPAAWFAYTRRGKDLNLAHSMGTVRFDPSPETRAQIERSAGTENFDPNLFDDRDAAVARLRQMESTRQEVVVHTPNYTPQEFAGRVTFHHGEEIMEVDFSNITFAHSRDVNDAYDAIDALVAETGRKWYFLVNYEGTRIFSGAWIQYAARGKALNEAASLGSVRFAAGSETATDIRLRAETGGFRPNIRNTRAEALERIAEMKQEAAEG